MKDDLTISADRVVQDLRELAQLTSDENGAQRFAWTPIWRKAVDWYGEKAAEFGAEVSIDAAGNVWAKVQGESDESLVVGSHLDSVKNGGWLDGALGAVAGLEVLRRASKTKPNKTVYAVGWADEEGARFGSSVMGSSASSGRFDIEGIKNRLDANGISAKEALAEYGIDIENILVAAKQLEEKKMAYFLELHIEQGPILESKNKKVSSVYGVQGIERHYLHFVGHLAHGGACPISMRKDPFLAAAKASLAFRELALKYDAMCTVGKVKVEPDIATTAPGKCTISLDQRSIDPQKLIDLNRESREVSQKIADEFGVKVTWDKIYSIVPTIFDEELTKLGQEAVEEETGEATTMFSGPLHDAVEMAILAPTTMMFASTADGMTHCAEEDTPEEDLKVAIRAFMRLADKVIAL